MRIQQRILSIVLASLLTLTLSAARAEAQTGRRPPTLHPTPRDDVERTFDIIATLYKPIAAKYDWTIEFKYDENNPMENAGAKQEGNRILVKVFGGLTRLLSMDEFAVTLCHEMGHHFGSAPYHAKKVGNVPKAAEGQADYHAGRSCVRRYFDYAPKAPVEGTPYMRQRCAAGFGQGTAEYQHCLRALNTFLYLNKMPSGRRAGHLALETPDRTVVSKTIVGRLEGDRVVDDYPVPQCRLDTLVAGYFKEPRPRCWYNPNDGLDYKEVFGNSGSPASVHDIATHPLASDIAEAIRLGLMRGYGDGTFAPQAPLKRLETALVLVELVRQTQGQRFSLPTPASAPFLDAAGVPWAHPALAFVRDHDLMTAYADGLFRPEESISKAYFSAALYKTLKWLHESASLQPLTDIATNGTNFADTAGHWSQGYARLLSGFCGAAFSENPPAFEPDRQVTRAYAAAAIVRAFQCHRRVHTQ